MFFDANGINIEYFDFGTASADLPVLLLHGYLGGDVASDWEQTGVLPALGAAGYRVLALHCRAHGKSDAPHDPTAYGQEMVRDIVRLVDHLNIPQLHLIGWSMGALLAANLALRFPQRIASAVLLASGPLSARQYAEDPVLQKVISGSVERLESGQGGFPILTYLAPTNRSEVAYSDSESSAMLNDMLIGRDPLALAALLRSWKDLALDDALLPEATVPVLAIIGTGDGPAGNVAALAGRWPVLRVQTIPGADHWFQGVPDGWSQVTESLIAFLRDR